MKMKKKIFSVSFALVVAVSLLAVMPATVMLIGCQKPLVTIETLLVPEKADAIAKVKISEILNDEDIADLYARYAVTDPYAPQTLRLALDELKEETGVDLRYFNEAVLFADTSTIEAQVPYLGAIIECNVPAKYFFEALEKLGSVNFEIQKYHAYTIHVLDDEVGIVFLNEELMVVGPVNVVKDVIDVGLGKGRPISGKPYELYDALDNPLLKATLKVPWMISKEIPTEIPLDDEPAVDLGPLRDVDMVSCVLDKSGSTIKIQVHLYFVNSSSAIDASESIQELITGAKHIWPVLEIRNLLNKVQVVTYGSQVLVGFDATLAEIKDLIGALERENLL